MYLNATRQFKVLYMNSKKIKQQTSKKSLHCSGKVNGNEDRMKNKLHFMMFWLQLINCTQMAVSIDLKELSFLAVL